MKKKLIRYWDSDCFLGWFNEESDKVEACKDIIDNAENGKVIIAHSAITLTEVIWLRDKTRIRREKEDAIQAFFERDYLRIFEVDRQIGNFARQLIWNHNIKPKDSIHVATAILKNIPVMNTFDGELINLDNTLDLKNGTKKLRIIRPSKLSPEELDLK